MPGHRLKSWVAYSASLLLAILLAHIVVMATPLHGWFMDPGHATGAGSSQSAPDDARMHHGVQIVETGGSDHCAFVWTLPSQRPSGLAPATGGIPSTSCLIVASSHRSSPTLPRTLSPPVGVDWQALLQVFRI